MSSSALPNVPSAALPNPRTTWLVGLLTVLANGLTLLILHWLPDERLDPGIKNFVIYSLLSGSFLFLANWFLWRSNLSGNWKFRLFLGLLAGVATLLFGFRLEGITGDVGRFRLVPRFRPKHDERLQTLVDGPGSTTTIDLTQTTSHDFPQFFGPNRRGVISGVQLADDWQTQPPRLIWKQPIGAGWSGFAIVGNYAVTQEQRGEQELVTCYELQTGKLLWSHSDPVRFTSALGGDGPRATVTIDQGRVYAQGATGLLSCLDGATGQLLWQRDIIAENGAENIAWGRSGSPLVVDDKVIVSAGGPQGKSLVAYHCQTGEPIWHSGDDVASYASPVVATLGGVKQVLSVNQDFVVGYDLASGRELWRIIWPGNSNSNASTSQPVPLPGDRILLSKGYQLGSALFELKRSENGSFAAERLWADATLLKTKLTNIVLHEGYAYGLSDGFLECVELETGNRAWKAPRRGYYGHGQILLVGNRLLITSEKGEVALVVATPERFEELGRLQAVQGVTWNIPALSGPYLLVRNGEEAACFELPVVAD